MRAVTWAAWLLGLFLAGTGPAVAAPTLTDLVETPDLNSLSVSPDGRWAVVREDRASVRDNDYRLTWWIVDTTGKSPPIRAGGAGGARIDYAGGVEREPAVWSADSRWFYFRALVDGAVQVWRGRADGGIVEAVTSDDADVTDFTLDGKTLAVTYRTGETRAAILAAEQAAYDNGVVVDASIDPAQSVHQGMQINGRMASGRLFGNWFWRQGILGGRPLRQRRIDAEGRAEDLGRTEPLPFYNFPRPGEDRLARTDGAGRTAFAADIDNVSILSLRAGAQGTPVRCAAAACKVDKLQWLDWTPDGDVVFLATLEDAGTQVGLWNPATGRARVVVREPGFIGERGVYGRSCALARAQVICIVQDVVSPPRLEAIDLRRPRRTVLFDPSRDVRPRLAVTAEKLAWTTNGYRFNAWLLLPSDRRAKGLPLFIQYYACTDYLRGGTGDEYPMAALAAQGVAALCVNAAREKGETKETQDSLKTYKIAVAGLQYGVAQLAKRGVIDPARVGMGGLSFGSEVTMRMVTDTRLIKVASISSVQMEPIYYWYNHVHGDDFRKTLRSAWGLGSPDETPARWREMSSAANVDRIYTPILMQLPEQESRFNYELFGRLQDRKIPTEMVVFPDEPHLKFQPRHKLSVYERNLDWFRFWLEGVEDGSLGKRAQFARWRALRAAQPAMAPGS